MDLMSTIVSEASEETNSLHTSRLDLYGVANEVPTRETMGGATLAVAKGNRNEEERRSSGHLCQRLPSLTT